MCIPASRDAEIELLAPPIRICFYAEVRGQRDVMFLDKVQELCGHVSDAIHTFAELFPEVDYTQRRDSWFAPDL